MSRNLGRKLYILSLIFCLSYSLKCGKEEIENCSKCGSGIYSNTCIKCEDKHFLFFNNLYCLPCNHPLYGQLGCEGNCDATYYLQNNITLCNKDDCQEGFFNLNGICYNCSEGSYGCKKCEVSFDENDEEPKYKCLECINDEYKLYSEIGRCYPCLYGNCRKCHYNITDDNEQKICDQCEENYYISNDYDFINTAENSCNQCYEKNIENGECTVCSDIEDNYESCSCDTYYTLKDNSTCVECPDKCSKCIYNSESNKTECIKCEPGYSLNSEKNCTFCGEGCEYCSLSNDLTPSCFLCSPGKILFNNECLTCKENCLSCDKDRCLECDEGFILLNDGTCEKCSTGCSSCKIENNKMICLQCEDDYALNSEKECIKCSKLKDEEGMKGCERCGYNSGKEKFECYECYNNEKNIIEGKDDTYVYILNTFQCLENNDKDSSYYGCLEIFKNESKYECLSCMNDFILIKNEKKCKSQEEIKLYNCKEAEIIEGTEPIYSCIECLPPFIRIKKGNQFDCMTKDNDLALCSEFEYDENNNNFICTKCAPNSHLNDKNICVCNSDSIFNENFEEPSCYKCNDAKYGDPHCDVEKGCSWNYYNIKCNQCKEGYFTFSENDKCIPCQAELPNCEKCHYDNSNNELICDKCLNGSIYNSTEQICELKNCEDYPEIFEGCIICEENFEEYIRNKKCHKCNPGYFKTKDEKCINCRTENFGGPDCLKCKYEQKVGGNEDNIICEYCPEKDHFLTPDGKCYNCQKSVTKNCEVCGLDNNSGKIICKICQPGYYLNSEGKCINYLNYIEIIENCQEYYYEIQNISFCASYGSSKHYYDEDDEENDNNWNAFYCTFNTINNEYERFTSYNEYIEIYNHDINISEINSNIKAKCKGCSQDYVFNSEGNCVKKQEENCSLISIAQNYREKFDSCRSLCYNEDKIFVEIAFKNNTNNNSVDIFDPLEYFNNHYYGEGILDNLDSNLLPLFFKDYLCIQKPNDSEIYKNCIKVQYDDKTNSYKCSKCINEFYILDNNHNNCKSIFNDNKDDYEEMFVCDFENIGTESSPIYSCKKCLYDDYVLVSTKNGQKFCLEEEEELENCTEAYLDTKYVKNDYICINCIKYFLPYNSDYFEKKICQNIYEDINIEKEINFEKYEGVESINSSEGGICEKENFFSPDGKKCYKCDDEKVGMPGCKGSCNYSLNRYNELKCDECDVGYIEIEEGICELCDTINNGCYECHYEDQYPNNYTKIKRERRFICDICEVGYIKEDGKCSTCNDFIENCEECEINSENKYICTECNKFSILVDGRCHECKFKTEFKYNDKCYECNDINNGGIKGCNMCEKNNNNELICQSCESNYILLSNNNSCLDRAENKELEKFDSCEKLTIDNNNQLYCTRCKKEYSLLKDNNNDKGNCMKINILYEHNIGNYISNYYRDYIWYSYYNPIKNTYISIAEDEYNYFANNKNYPCEESINIGTNTNPIYSCMKCYNRFEFDKAIYETSKHVKIINERNNVSYCSKHLNSDIYENCTEAINKTKNGVIKYDCTKCPDENVLVFNNDLKINFCKYNRINKKCNVHYCKSCQNNNNYFCSECFDNYIINNITGKCIKLEEIPAISWKDIYGLKMNINKEIKKNGQTYNGPSLNLRGLTSYKIDKNHAFIIYLIFKIKPSRIRNLQETEKIKLKTICEPNNNLIESSNDTYIVDYECISNNTLNYDLNNYEFDGIEQGENEGLLKNDNLNELANNIPKENLLREQSSFTFEELFKYVTFIMDEIKNQTSKNYIFDFKINGKLGKVLEKMNISTDLKLNEINESAKCYLIVEENKNASLNCLININKYKNKNLFTFKTLEVKEENNNIFLSKLDEVMLINDEKESNDEEKDDDKDYTGVIVGCGVAGVVLIGGGIALIIYLKKKPKIKIDNNSANNNIMKETIEGEQKERVIPMEINSNNKIKV